MKSISPQKHFGFGSGGFTDETSAAIWTYPSNHQVLNLLKNGQVTIEQAAELLGIEPAFLALQFFGKVDCNQY